MRGGAVAAAGVLAAAGLALAASLSTLSPAAEAAAAQALTARLEARALSVRWVRCVESSERFAGEPAFRCTVNFGDPHLVPYCVARVGGVHLTDRERPEMRCYPPAEEARYRENALLGPDG